MSEWTPARLQAIDDMLAASLRKMLGRTFCVCPMCGDDEFGPWIASGPFIDYCESCHDRVQAAQKGEKS